MRPVRRLEKVTCRLLLFSISLISTFLLPMAASSDKALCPNLSLMSEETLNVFASFDSFISIFFFLFWFLLFGQITNLMSEDCFLLLNDRENKIKAINWNDAFRVRVFTHVEFPASAVDCYSHRLVRSDYHLIIKFWDGLRFIEVRTWEIDDLRIRWLHYFLDVFD